MKKQQNWAPFIFGAYVGSFKCTARGESAEEGK